MAAIPWRAMIEAYERDIRALIRAYAIMGAEGLLDIGDPEKFQKAAERVASRMVSGLSRFNYKNWREAAFKSGHGRKIYGGLKRELGETEVRQTLQRIAWENARLIRSIPFKVAREITAHSMQAQMEGKRAPEIAKELRLLAPKLTESKIRLISRTEIGRAESAITQTRAEQIGVEWFQWLTSRDQRVRYSHRNMSDVLVNFNDLPSPEALVGEHDYGKYSAGSTFNCRCLCAPLISLDEVSWPSRVYRAGSITRMTRAAFTKIAGFQIAA